MLIRDWIDWSNSTISVLGLGLTLGTLWFAKSASQAASEAKQAVQGHNVADTFTETVHLADQFANWVKCERWPEAAVLLRDILLRLARNRGQFAQFYASCLSQLTQIEEDAQILLTLLSQETEVLENREKNALVDRSFTISRELNCVLGQVQALRQKEEQ